MTQPASKRARALARTWLAWPPARRLPLTTGASGTRKRSARFELRRMKTVLAVAGTLVVLPAITFAGLGHGTNRFANRPMEGAACNDMTLDSTSTTNTTAAALNAPLKAESEVATSIHSAPPRDVLPTAGDVARAARVAEPPLPARGATAPAELPAKMPTPAATAKNDNPLYL